MRYLPICLNIVPNNYQSYQNSGFNLFFELEIYKNVFVKRFKNLTRDSLFLYSFSTY